ncbi:MAG: NIPSNAP family protein [Acidobacteriota bacterium]
MSQRLPIFAVTVFAFAAGFGVRGITSPAVTVQAAAANRVFEVRTYTTPPGKLEALKSRFRDHTIRLFNKQHMESVAYFTPLDAPDKDNTLIYVLAHPSREDATKNWAAFRADPDWVKAKADSEKDGALTTKVTSVFVEPADFSPIK